MISIRRLILAVAAVMTASCASPPQSAAQDVEITLTRSVCFGFCPDYSVTINGDGGVRYEGRRFVNVVGVRTASIPRATVAALVRRFDDIGFERLRDDYRAQVTDLPTYTVSIRRNGRTKIVRDYAGVEVGMPRAVREIQDEIDHVAGTAQWVLRNGQSVRDSPQR